jgi:ribonucleoside-diphosphate reductase alpha chain
VNKFSHTRFEPMGHTKNPDIRIAKSIVDYIFRWMGMNFLPGYREASLGLPPAGESEAKETAEAEPKPVAKKADGPKGHGEPNGVAAASVNGVNGHASGKSEPSLLYRAGAALDAGEKPRDEQFASFQTDAPSCDNCGAITVRNGNCYLCHNCGNSMGCS